MELRTEKVYTEEKKGPATTQLTFDETYHLPDYLPDFFSVILSRGQIRMDETKCSQGHVQVQGTLQFRVLYRTGQNEWNICSLEGEIPFHEMMTLDEAKEHMEYMARMKRVFDEVFDKTEFRVNAYPSTPTQMGLVFCDELGMLYIDDRTGGRGKMPELIRYDQIASYEEYLDETPAKEPGQEPTLNGGGLKLKLVQPRSITEAQTQRGMRPHPYIKQELVICFSKRDRREIGYAHIARQHLDHIFGVHDNETSLFGRRMSKAEERELKGQVGMISAMGAVASAAMKGGQLSEQEKARFVENINLANDAQTGGMAVYSRRADEAFAKVQ